MRRCRSDEIEAFRVKTRPGRLSAAPVSHVGFMKRLR
jgi:hypothetical protein